MNLPDRYAFGGFVLERTQQRVCRTDGTAVALSPRLFSALLAFVEHPDELLDKSALLETVWPGLVVEDNNLNQVVSGLRRALGDDAHGSRYIETVPRRGFRFVAPVTVLSGGDEGIASTDALPPAPVATERRSRMRHWLAGAAVATVGVLIMAAVRLDAPAPAPASSIGAALADARSIAVMPFTDLSEPKAPHVAYAVDHELTMDLGRLDNMRVIPRESSAALGTSEAMDPRRVGRELGVRYVLAGSVRQVGGSLSVTIQLLRTDTGALLWSDRFDYPSVADWAVRRKIPESVANLLDTKVQQSALERAVQSPSSSAAVDHWMRGAYLMSKVSTREQLLVARGHFEAALAAQPDSVPALTGLAFTYDTEVLYRWSPDTKASLATAKTLARRALALAPDDQNALKALAGALDFNGEMEEAMTTTQRVLQLNPNDADAARELAVSLYFLGRWEEALRQVDVAERLNPLDSGRLWKLETIAGTALIPLHRYDEAAERARRIAALNPASMVALTIMASAEAHRNNLPAARQYAAEILRREPDFWVERNMPTRGSKAPAYLEGMAHVREGLKLAGLPSRSSDTVPLQEKNQHSAR